MSVLSVFWTSKKSKRSSLVSTISSVKSIVYTDDASIYTHMYRQTNKQTNKLSTVIFILWYLVLFYYEIARHNFVIVPDQKVHYAEHTHTRMYTNEMATGRNLRFRIESRTRQRCWWWWWCRARGVLCAYIYKSAIDTYIQE